MLKQGQVLLSHVLLTVAEIFVLEGDKRDPQGATEDSALTAGRALSTHNLLPATCTGKGELKTVTDTRLVEQSSKIPNGFKQTQPHVYYFCSTSLFKPKHMILRQLTQGF